jgi:hypothetical protein
MNKQILREIDIQPLKMNQYLLYAPMTFLSRTDALCATITIVDFLITKGYGGLFSI